MIPITKKEILTHLEGSPIMTCIRSGSLQDLKELKTKVNAQIKMRKNATLESCGTVLLLAVIFTSIVTLFARATLTQLIWCQLATILISYGCWAMTTGSRFYEAAMIERVMTTLIDAAITEKQIAAAHQNSTNATTSPQSYQ